MSYTPRSVSVPVLTGAALRASAALLELPVPGSWLAGASFSAIGLPAFRKLLVSGPPLFQPLINPAGGHPGTEHPPSEPPPLEPPPLPGEEFLELLRTSPPAKGSFTYTSVLDYAHAYRSGTTSPEAVADTLIQTLQEHNRHGEQPLYIMTAWDEKMIRQAAAESAERINAGTARSILEGVPVVVKDEINQRGFATTLGTKKTDLPAESTDAWSVQRLRDAGALLLGKATMHEIGIGVTGLNPQQGAPINPYAPERVPGGSSSGSGSAVGSGLCPVALGADGGGSVRIPAAYCGVYGLKTTWGRVSATGEYPLGATVGNIGPLGATVRDVAIAYLTISGFDPADPTTHGGPPPNLDGFLDPLAEIRIGVDPAWFADADPEVVAPARQMLEYLKSAGAHLVDIEIDHLQDLRNAHLVTISSEMRDAMIRFTDSWRVFGPETRTNLALARYLTTADYLLAQRVRRQMVNQLTHIFTTVDLIATPATANLPPLLPAGDLSRARWKARSDVGSMDATMRFLTLANMTGNPAITAPTSFIDQRIPTAIQFIGRHWEEALLLRTARVCEEALNRPAPALDLRPLPPAVEYDARS